MLKTISHLVPSIALAGLFALAFAIDPALAQGLGQPAPGALTLMEPATPIAREIKEFHDMVNIIIIAIAVFVLALMIYVCVRFSEKKNPNPSTTTHHTLLEVAWTVVPIIILVVIAIPSFKLLQNQYTYPPPDLTIKAIGNAWFWEHEYPDHDDVVVTSTMLSDEEVAERSKALGIDVPRLLAVDNDIFVPVNKVVHVLVTSNDVLHNWTVQSFGSKIDAVPGRLTATWFKAEKEGIFYGQCSELCGMNHAFMPIAVRVVSQETFDEWIAAQKEGDDDKIKAITDRVAMKHAGLRKIADASQAKTTE